MAGLDFKESGMKVKGIPVRWGFIWSWAEDKGGGGEDSCCCL